MPVIRRTPVTTVAIDTIYDDALYGALLNPLFAGDNVSASQAAWGQMARVPDQPEWLAI